MKNVVITSEPGFEPALDAEIVGSANDYIHHDPSGKYMRLDAHGVVKSVSPFFVLFSPPLFWTRRSTLESMLR